ncbi:MAG: SOS response-associated peptidase family protein [Uliginosibacterium sp.]|nr:SOS response-associated peptidase family protein [Uliginosibacterium sp.]
MCANYLPPSVRELERLWELKHHTPNLSFPAETWPGYGAPFLSNFDPTTFTLGCFGLVPQWAEPKLARNTYNARAETVGEKPSYRNAWKQRQLCIIPALAIYEPNYESGKAVRWRIERTDKQPFGIAGIWERRLKDEGVSRWSFTMLTLNADAHPLMQRFHKPEDEKRSVVILDPDDYRGWLQARSEADARSYLKLCEPERMQASPEPLAPRRK